MKRSGQLVKKSVVVDSRALQEWSELGEFANDSEAIRAALEEAIAVRQMQRAIERIQRRGTFGRNLRLK